MLNENIRTFVKLDSQLIQMWKFKSPLLCDTIAGVLINTQRLHALSSLLDIIGCHCEGAGGAAISVVHTAQQSMQF